MVGIGPAELVVLLLVLLAGGIVFLVKFFVTDKSTQQKPAAGAYQNPGFQNPGFSDLNWGTPQIARPPMVENAVKLLWISFGIGILQSVLNFSYLTRMASSGEVFIIMILTLGLMGFFIYMIWKGYNWARIAFLVLFIIGIPATFTTLIQNFERNVISGFLSLVQTILQIVALFFLFQQESSDWYKMKKMSTNHPVY